ncbi:MAG TPA: hypothetical protein VMI75_05720 [Polyangiaceae bacterium]|nr:hypothetical protein [Polyangiaceae bacterium]
MRVVGIAIITALLSAGCAIQAGEPLPEESQRPTELVGVSGGGVEPGANTHPQVLPHSPLGKNGPAADSPNPSPWTGGSTDPHTGNDNGDPSGSGSGSGGNTDNPNPSPWQNGTGPHWGGAGNGGTGG